MRIPIPAVVFATLAAASTLPAQQVRVGARLGATWTSTLLEDVIVSPIKVKAGIAPTLSLTASIPVGARYRMGLEGVFSTGSVHATENGQETDLGSLRTGSLMLMAEGPLMVKDFFWRAGVGVIKYLPSEKEGIFLQGGPSRLAGNFTVEYRRVIRTGWEGIGALRYGYQSFMTDELKSRGFTRAQAVHRVGLEAGVARYF